MSSQPSGKPASIGVGGRRFTAHLRIGATLFALATAVAACMPQSARLAAADPSDPAVRVKGVEYRSTIAPYSGLRPAAPTSWRERNENVTPKPKQESQ